MHFKIQTGDSVNTSELISLYNRCFEKTHKGLLPNYVPLNSLKDKGKENLLQTIKSSPKDVIVAISKESNQLLGFLIIKSPSCDTAEIVSLYVDLNYKRRGVASFLLQDVISRFQKVSASVFENNYPAINLYQKFNFKVPNPQKTKNIFGVSVITFCLDN